MNQNPEQPATITKTWRRGFRFRPAVLAGAVAIVIVPLAASAADTDSDGLDDQWETDWFGTLASGASDDPDDDGLHNADEQAAFTNPINADTDFDGLSDADELLPPSGRRVSDPTRSDTDSDLLSDGEEAAAGTYPDVTDTDGDGLSDYTEVKLVGSNPLATDSDNGFSDDGREVLVDGTNPADPSDDRQDSDGDGISDYVERQVLGTDRLRSDTDGDGIPDKEEEQYGTSPRKADTDGDYLTDGEEVLYYRTDPTKPDTDGDELTDFVEVTETLTHPLLPDTDWDSVPDGQEDSAGMNPLDPDTDGGGVLDPVELHDGTDPNDPADDDGRDTDGDGLSDEYENSVTLSDPALADSDADNKTDAQEVFPLDDHLTTRPMDADTDDDGILDGNEFGRWDLGGVVGGTIPTARDSDADGLSDGVETGLTEPQVSTLDPDATDMTKFQADADPSTTTNAYNMDTDSDGLRDGQEDRNHNGRMDSEIGDPYYPDGETDPKSFDTDGDGMDDAWEVLYSNPGEGIGPALNPLDPADANGDPDADGLTSLREYRNTRIDPAGGKEIENRTNPRDPDSDDDLLSDGKEVLSMYGGGLKTDPNIPDSDADGIMDGIEDADGDGRFDPGETSPTRKDTDGDGLPDGQEDVNFNGETDPGETNPTMRDTDGDGLDDGAEVRSWGTDPLRTDTDGDDLPDGLEAGVKNDSDPSTRTNPARADTDDDGIDDGDEDMDHDGRVDTDETDPLLPDTDGDGLGDGLETGRAGDGDPSTVTNPLDRDTDGDRLIDGVEDRDHDGTLDPSETDPDAADTDKGGVPDGIEVFVDGTNPLDPRDDRAGDPDGDGIQTWQERLINTDPLDPDTDDDNISDGEEVGPDPAFPRNTDGDDRIDALDDDSDADGILDIDEAGDTDLSTPPRDTDSDEKPDFRDDDSDDDGISDRVEHEVDSDLDEKPNPNVDMDSLPNHLDPDTDDDGKSDRTEGTGDQDDDGIPNFADADDDTPFTPPDADAAPESAETVEALPDAVDDGGRDVIEDSAAPDVNDDASDPGQGDVNADPGNEDSTAAELDSADSADSSGDTTEDMAEADSSDVDPFAGKLQGSMMCSQASFDGRNDAADMRGLGFLCAGTLAVSLAAMAAFRIAPARGKRRKRKDGCGIFRKVRHGSMLFLLAVVTAIPARAESQTARQDPGQIPAKRYSVKSGAGGILSTDTGRVMEFLEYEAGMSLIWAGPSIIQQVDGSKPVTKWLSNRFDSEIWAGLGIFKRVDLTVSMPITWFQQGLSKDGGDAAKVGIGGISFVPRVNILDERRGDETTLGIVTEFVAPTLKSDYFGSGSFEFLGKLAMSMTRFNFTMAMDIWYRFLLNDREVYNFRDDDQIGFAMGLAYQLKALPLKIMADASVAVPVVRPFFEKEEVISEVMIGLGYRIWNFNVQLAGGAGLSPGAGVPGGRLLASVAWTTAGTRKVKTADESLQDDLAREASKKTGSQADNGSPTPEDPAGSDRNESASQPSADENADRDGDGVADKADKCPDTAGSSDEAGCPPPQPEVEKPAPALRDRVLGDMVMFDTGSAVIKPRFFPMLDEIARKLKKSRAVETVVLEGHTSLTGTDDVNMELSKKRALAVRKYLIKKGVPEQKVIIRPRGTESPIVPEKGEKADPLNQRVQFRIVIGEE